MVAGAYNLSYLGGEAGESLEPRTNCSPLCNGEWGARAEDSGWNSKSGACLKNNQLTVEVDSSIMMKRISRNRYQKSGVIFNVPSVSPLTHLTANGYKFFEHFGRPRLADQLRSGIRDQPGQHGETPSLLKIQKLARHSGGGGRRITGAQKAEVAVSRDQATVFQPGQQSETLSQKNKQKIMNDKTFIRWSFALVAQDGVHWCDLSSPQSPPPGFKQFSCLSLPIEMGFLHVGQAGLQLPTSGDQPTSASYSAGITGVSHRTRPHPSFLGGGGRGNQGALKEHIATNKYLCNKQTKLCAS
ncbi:Protein GVQW1 [Plecturocebus cupreus]